MYFELDDMGAYSIEDLVERLSEEDGNKPLKLELSGPHSYRGYYKELALEPGSGSMRVCDLIELLEGAIGETYTGYKGGEFTMGPSALVFIANYGSCGVPLTPSVLYVLFDGEVTMTIDDIFYSGYTR